MIITGNPTDNGMETEVTMDNGDTSSSHDEQHQESEGTENEPD